MNGKLGLPKTKGALGPVAGASAATRSRVAFGDDDLLSKMGTLKEVLKTQLTPDPNQPRSEFAPEALAELTLSIEENGIIQPILVTELEDGIGNYRILAGERRWRAAMASDKIQTVPVIIRSDLTDDLRILLLQITENIHRSDMNPLETAQAYKRVFEATGEDTDETAKLLGISKSRLSQILAVDDAPKAVKDLVQDGVTSDSIVVAGLSTLTELDGAKAEALIDKARSGELKGGGLREAVKDTVRTVKSENKQRKQPKQQPDPVPLQQPEPAVEHSEEALPVTPIAAPEQIIVVTDDFVTLRLKRSSVNELKRIVASVGEGETITELLASLEEAEAMVESKE